MCRTEPADLHFELYDHVVLMKASLYVATFLPKSQCRQISLPFDGGMNDDIGMLLAQVSYVMWSILAGMLRTRNFLPSGVGRRENPGKNRTAKCLSERERENFNQAVFALAFFSRRQDRELPGAISRGLLDCPCRV